MKRLWEFVAGSGFLGRQAVRACAGQFCGKRQAIKVTKTVDRQPHEVHALKCAGQASHRLTHGFLKAALVIICALLPALNGCAALLDGKFVPRDGKQTPFKPLSNPYEPPRDPTAR